MNVRSYVIAPPPHALAKDLRTAVETADVHAVLDGDLDAFLTEALRQRVHIRWDFVRDLTGGPVPEAD